MCLLGKCYYSKPVSIFLMWGMEVSVFDTQSGLATSISPLYQTGTGTSLEALVQNAR